MHFGCQCTVARLQPQSASVDASATPRLDGRSRPVWYPFVIGRPRLRRLNVNACPDSKSRIRAGQRFGPLRVKSAPAETRVGTACGDGFRQSDLTRNVLARPPGIDREPGAARLRRAARSGISAAHRPLCKRKVVARHRRRTRRIDPHERGRAGIRSLLGDDFQLLDAYCVVAGRGTADGVTPEWQALDRESALDRGGRCNRHLTGHFDLNLRQWGARRSVVHESSDCSAALLSWQRRGRREDSDQQGDDGNSGSQNSQGAQSLGPERLASCTEQARNVGRQRARKPSRPKGR